MYSLSDFILRRSNSIERIEASSYNVGSCAEGLHQLIYFQTLNWYWPISSGLARSAQTLSQVNCPTSLYHSDTQWLNPSAWLFGILTISPATNTEPKTGHVWKPPLHIGVYCSLPCHEFAFQMAVKYLWALLMCFTARSCLVFCCCN